MINSIYVDNIIKTALLEDINYLDAATDYLIDEDQENTARFLAKADGVLCGIDIALRVFELLQPQGFTATVYKHDGDVLEKGDIIAEIHGKTRTLLKGERTALNLLQHMSGVATATNKAVNIVAGTKASIADTRKTMPGLRPLQKYAVTVGGGRNHRFNLSDAAMLKDNHVDAGGGIANAVAKLKSKLGHMTKIELEVRNLDELGQALEAGVDPKQVREEMNALADANGFLYGLMYTAENIAAADSVFFAILPDVIRTIDLRFSLYLLELNTLALLSCLTR